MDIFDCHFHIENFGDDYELENVVARNVIFNDVDIYKQNIEKVNKNDFITLVFDYKNNLDFVLDQIRNKKVHALKIISREQKLKTIDYPILIEKLKLDNSKLPIIIDAFYYDHNLEYQPSLKSIIDIATTFPNRRIIVAHSGGHNVLTYFFHLRTLKNVFYDLSFSLQYLKDSSVFQDLIKLIKYTDKSKILFGTDFPWANSKLQYDVLYQICEELKLNKEEINNIFYKNSYDTFDFKNY